MTDDNEAPRPWRWRNCRSLFVSVTFAPLPWTWLLGVDTYTEGGGDTGGCYGRTWMLMLGPVSISVCAGIGNNSTGDWRARFGLSEEEAWERSK